MTPENIKIKCSKDEFIVLVNIMRIISNDYEDITGKKNIDLLLSVMFVKLLYKFEKKLIPLQLKYSIKLETECAICLYLHLNSIDADNLGIYERTVISTQKNQIHQMLLS